MGMLTVLALANAVALSPSGPWNVDAGDNMCLLARPYGAGSDQLILGFQPIFNQSRMEVIVIGPRKASLGQTTGTATIERKPDGKSFKGSFVSLENPSKGRRATRISIDRAVFDDLAGTAELRIKAAPVDERFQIVRAEKALPVFAKCQDDLLRSWGVDPANGMSDRRATPTVDIATFFKPEDYPKKALADRYIGDVTAILNIDARGTVVNCRVIVGAGPDFNAATCARASMATFKAAVDGAGAPVASIYVLRVRWALPTEPPAPSLIHR